MLLLVAKGCPLPTQATVARIELACLAASRAALAPEGIGSLVSNQAEKPMVDRKCRTVPGYKSIEEDGVILKRELGGRLEM
jgi:hypothetical protein